MENKEERTIESLIPKSMKIGDKLDAIFDKTQDIKVIAEAIKAYRNSISASITCIRYKVMTGHPEKIKYMLDKNRD